MNDSYKVLDSISIIRLRPGMFVGDTETPTHLVHEVIDNALDEVINDRASMISVYINKDTGETWCCDNGSGLKIYDMQLDDGVFDSVVVLCTRLFSGSKFDTSDYKKLLGMHGVGLVSINALSEWMTVITRYDNKTYTYQFRESELVDRSVTNDDSKFSTIVGFKPHPKYFKSTEVILEELVERLILSSVLYDCEIYLNDNKIPKIELNEYVKSKLGVDAELEYITSNTDHEYLMLALCATPSDSPISVISVVNTRFLQNSKAQQMITNIIKQNVKDALSKRKIGEIPDRYLTIGIRMFLIMQLNEPKYDSQTKVRMTSNPVHLIEPIESQIKKFVDNNIDIIQSNIEKKIKKKISTNRKDDVNILKLRDCEIIPGKVLYILEGDSADGTLKKVRDTKTEAIFPLRGKILNVESSSLTKINENKEVRDLLKALGPVESRRYERIAILADADADGFHIVVLTLILILKFAPDYVENEAVDVIIPPLYMAYKKNDVKLLYGADVQQIDKLKKQKYEIVRFKGLGEMDAEILEYTIRRGLKYTISAPSKDMAKKLLELVTDTDMRRELINSPISLSNLMNAIGGAENVKSNNSNNDGVKTN